MGRPVACLVVVVVVVVVEVVEVVVVVVGVNNVGQIRWRSVTGVVTKAGVVQPRAQKTTRQW